MDNSLLAVRDINHKYIVVEKGVFIMLRRYELTDDEWNRIVDLLPPENTGKQGRPRKNNRTILNP